MQESTQPMHTIGPPGRGRTLALIMAPLASFFLLLGAAGCGQRGPLYLPDREPRAGTAPADANETLPGDTGEDTGGQGEADRNEPDEETP